MIEGIDTEKLAEHAKELEELFNKKILLCTKIEDLTNNNFSGNVVVIRNHASLDYSLYFTYKLNEWEISFEEKITHFESHCNALERVVEHLTQSLKKIIARNLMSEENINALGYINVREISKAISEI